MSKRQSLETRVASLIAAYGLEPVYQCIRMAVEMSKPTPEPKKRLSNKQQRNLQMAGIDNDTFTKESA